MILLSKPPVAGTITVVRFTKGGTISSNTGFTALGGTPTTGNTIVAIVGTFSNTDAAISISGVAISPGSGTFTKIISQPEAAGQTTFGSCEAWVCPNVTSGTTPTVTATYSTAPNAVDLFLYEISGLPTTLKTSGTASGKAGTTATACTAPSITTTDAVAIVFALFNPAHSMTAGGFTNVQIGVNAGCLAEYQIQSTIQSGLVPTGTQNSTGTYGAITFALAA